MNKTPLFVRHQAKPGKGDDVQRVWEKHVKPRVAANPAHEVYFFCYDDNDPDVICVFRLYRDIGSVKDFLKGEWYAEYLREVSQFIESPPQLTLPPLFGPRGRDTTGKEPTPSKQLQTKQGVGAGYDEYQDEGAKRTLAAGRVSQGRAAPSLFQIRKFRCLNFGGADDKTLTYDQA